MKTMLALVVLIGSSVVASASTNVVTTASVSNTNAVEKVVTLEKPKSKGFIQNVFDRSDYDSRQYWTGSNKLGHDHFRCNLITGRIPGGIKANIGPSFDCDYPVGNNREIGNTVIGINITLVRLGKN